MSSTEARREVKRSGYLPMTSLNDSSPHQKDAKDAAVSSSRRQLSTDFRMIPNEADCQVNAVHSDTLKRCVFNCLAFAAASLFLA